MPPVVMGGVVVPAGLLAAMQGRDMARFPAVDREAEKLGYDIEGKDPRSGQLRFLEVKGRVEDADTVTVTKNENLYSLNQPDQFILALVEFTADDGDHVPCLREPDFGVTSVNYDLTELVARAQEPG